MYRLSRPVEHTVGIDVHLIVRGTGFIKVIPVPAKVAHRHELVF